MTLARVWMAAIVLLGACRSGERAPESPNATAAADSAYAPSVMIARFRERVPERPAAFGGGAAGSADSVIGRYVRGLEARDTAALAGLALTMSEFAWLYYLDSPTAQKPYELDPDAMWLQISSQSGRGLTRALATYGGRPLGPWRSVCGAPRQSGTLRLLDCTVTVRPAGAASDEALRLSVVERDGRFKLVGLATSL